MAGERRINVTLTGPEAERLRALAERAHVQEGTLARSLLASALDRADPSAGDVVAILYGIPGALARARAGTEQVRAGQTVALDDL